MNEQSRVFQATYCLGVALIVLGVWGFTATGHTHQTALIPAYVGIVFVILGVLAMKANLRKHAIHAAAALALLGFVGTVSGIVGALKLITGGEVERPAAVISKAIMSFLCLAYVVWCVRSFIAARKARKAGAAA